MNRREFFHFLFATGALALFTRLWGDVATQQVGQGWEMNAAGGWQITPSGGWLMSSPPQDKPQYKQFLPVINRHV